jgi:hypothetical protein
MVKRRRIKVIYTCPLIIRPANCLWRITLRVMTIIIIIAYSVLPPVEGVRIYTWCRHSGMAAWFLYPRWGTAARTRINTPRFNNNSVITSATLTLYVSLYVECNLIRTQNSLSLFAAPDDGSLIRTYTVGKRQRTRGSLTLLLAFAIRCTRRRLFLSESRTRSSEDFKLNKRGMPPRLLLFCSS